jgi:hypothetical protein
VLRVAGTVNFKTGRYARIIEANLGLPPYDWPAWCATSPTRPSRLQRKWRSGEGRGEGRTRTSRSRHPRTSPARRDHRPSARWARPVPGTRRRAPLVLGFADRAGLEMPRLRRWRDDLRSRLGGAGRTDRWRAARRGVQARPGVRHGRARRWGRTMSLAGVQPGDVVLVARRGRRFYAIVARKEQGSWRSSRSTGASPIARSRRARWSRSGTSADGATEPDRRNRTEPHERRQRAARMDPTKEWWWCALPTR